MSPDQSPKGATSKVKLFSHIDLGLRFRLKRQILTTKLQAAKALPRVEIIVLRFIVVKNGD